MKRMKNNFIQYAKKLVSGFLVKKYSFNTEVSDLLNSYNSLFILGKMFYQAELPVGISK